MNHLGLFAKFWQPGTVKTRLAKSIGDQAACQVYRCFVNHLLDRHQLTGDSRCVVFSPPEKRSDFREAISDAWDVFPQSAGDLGDRMGSYFRARLETESEGQDRDSIPACHKVVIIGADCPLLDGGVVSTAFDLLDQVPVVIEPSHDGGYCMIAMSNPAGGRLPDLFSDVDWGTPTVLEQTIAHLKRQQVEFHLMDPVNDVDEIEDLFELKSDLESRSRDALDEKLFEEVKLALSSVTPPKGAS